MIFRFLMVSVYTLFLLPGQAQEETRTDTIKKVTCDFRYSGQLSVWAQAAPNIDSWLWLGGRYIPQMNFGLTIAQKHRLDFELSANLFGNIGARPFSKIEASGKVKPYRAWIRYSGKQAEARLGLQKINFGSAQMFRPLMWFDTMDPRDPLQLTDGVWGGLFRYYFTNNINLWFWALYGNKNAKGWEAAGSSQRFPELGTRAQFPFPQGEVGISYHFRQADYNKLLSLGRAYERIPENRVGFDIRIDRVIGLWLEGSWTGLTKNMGELTHQEMFTLGGDYTFGIGNGLGLTFEQMLYSYDEKAFRFANITTLSGLMLTYPVGLFDDLSLMLYFDWMEVNLYSFISWQHQFRHLALHVMAYWNPKTGTLPGQTGNGFQGKGIQVMLVWNH